MLPDISGSGHQHAKPDDPRNFVERSQMLPHGSEGVERCQESGLASRLHIELRADTRDEFRFAAYSGKHSGEKEQVARLHRFRVDAERLRRRWKRDAKLTQPLLGSGKTRAIPA